MKRCCAYGCKAKSGAAVKFYNFPTCRARSKEWLRALNRPDILADVDGNRLNLLKYYYVCEAHISWHNIATALPVLHIVNKGTNTDKNTNLEDKGTSTEDLDQYQASNGTNLMLHKLTRTEVSTIDIPPASYYNSRTKKGPVKKPEPEKVSINIPVPNVNRTAEYVLKHSSTNVPETDSLPAAETAKPVAPAQVGLRNFRKNNKPTTPSPVIPTIAVKKLQTDIPTTKTSQIPNIQPNESENVPEIKTEPNALVLDDIVMALSERQRNEQPSQSPIDGREIMFKVKMNLPFFTVEEATTSGIKRELDDDVDVTDNPIKIEEKRTKPG
ncbi:uncharacterized protein LOC125236414 [Leguminivora glycinivorella]|uniref:uncharacterized protein LOC125236384 n=1 Tax=Leguminivora glycinivorella TaxID=1035111 RepID=UPI00200BCFF4|nr:uncharacterized protein LOC125236384 [Leguminivora glycinivorella]XP_047999164.1 uncharacterized protein LOC125236414 [Leguminivora glycinivorella]